LFEEKLEEIEKLANKYPIFSLLGEYNLKLIMLEYIIEEFPGSIDKYSKDLLNEKTTATLEIFKKNEMFLKIRSDEKLTDEEKSKKVTQYFEEFLNNEGYKIEIGFFKKINYEVNEFLKEMTLVYLISAFEDFLMKTFMLMYKLIPEMQKGIDIKAGLEDIKKSSNLEELVDKILEKKCEKLISGDIQNPMRYIKKNFKVDFMIEPFWSKFKERFYRRNIIVHNSNKVDEKYRSKTGYDGKETKLPISIEYMHETLRLFEKFAIIYIFSLQMENNEDFIKDYLEVGEKIKPYF